MGFLSLLFLMCLSMLMYGRADESASTDDSIAKKAFKTLQPYEETIGYYGIFFGLLAVAASILFMPPYYWGYGMYFVLRPLANGLLVAMALPFGYKKFLKHFKKVTPDTREMLDSKVTAILKNHRIFAYAGFATCALLFMSMNRFY